jgi:glutamate decarboxylase
LIGQSLALASSYAQLVNEHPSFELTSVPETNILTYRFVPEPWLPVLERLKYRDSLDITDSACLHYANDFLSDVNIEIQKQQRLEGRSFVSRTTLESVYPDSRVAVLRAVLMNPFTTPAVIDGVLADQVRIGAAVLAEKAGEALAGAPQGFVRLFPL